MINCSVHDALKELVIILVRSTAAVSISPWEDIVRESRSLAAIRSSSSRRYWFQLVLEMSLNLEVLELPLPIILKFMKLWSEELMVTYPCYPPNNET